MIVIRHCLTLQEARKVAAEQRVKEGALKAQEELEKAKKPLARVKLALKQMKDRFKFI